MVTLGHNELITYKTHYIEFEVEVQYNSDSYDL